MIAPGRNMRRVIFFYIIFFFFFTVVFAHGRGAGALFANGVWIRAGGGGWFGAKTIMTAVVVTRWWQCYCGGCNIIGCRDGEAILATSAAIAATAADGVGMSGRGTGIAWKKHPAGMISRRRRRQCHSLLTQCSRSGVGLMMMLMALNTRLY